MKYKVGDRVVIKTKEEFIKDHTLGDYDELFLNVEKELKDIGDNRIVTIIGFCYDYDEDSYIVDISANKWAESIIKCLVEEPIYKPINSRFEILDL